MTNVAKRSKKQKNSQDAHPTPKRYFFVTDLSKPPTRYISGWIPRPEWETLDVQDRLRLKSCIPNDLPYNVSIRTKIPDPNLHVDEEPLQRCVVPHHSMKDCLAEVTTVPSCSVSAPLPGVHKEWRAFKEEDREDDEYKLMAPTWKIATDGKFRCTACSRAFVKKTSLTRHFRTMHVDPRGRSSKPESEEHSRRFTYTHTGQMMCGKCGQMFGRKAGFEGHWRRQHTVKQEDFDSDQETL